jgi:hypothetical protein
MNFELPCVHVAPKKGPPFLDSRARILCWSDSDLDERICDDCAQCLVKVENTLLKLNLDGPSPELIHRNP